MLTIYVISATKSYWHWGLEQLKYQAHYLYVIKLDLGSWTRIG